MNNIPAHWHAPLQAYITAHAPLDTTLQAVVANDIPTLLANGINLLDVLATTQWLLNEAPLYSWGTKAHYHAWVSQGAGDKNGDNVDNSPNP